MNKLFEPIKIGSLDLKNRIIMAPLTRARAINGRIPNDLMAEYYAQRASAGLIISEATSVHPMGVGYANTPGIWTDEHVLGWKKITKSVHDKNGKIILQLWHVGRVSDPIFLNGLAPVAPSAVQLNGNVSIVRPERPYIMPRALELHEISEIVNAYKTGAQNAKNAGFDGVEIHAANGYLIDQFLHDGSNLRNDQYGGSIENRSRLLLEITDAVISVWGADKVGVHLSPRGDSHEMKDSNPIALYEYVATELGIRKIAFIFTREYQGPDSLSAAIKKRFGGPIIVNEKFTRESALKITESGEADAVAFGLNFISNPDLVVRFKENRALNTTDFLTLYGDGPLGYTDYPTL